MTKPTPESVWDYPRPPRVETSNQRIRIIFNGETVADSAQAFRVLETTHPPVYYLPQTDIAMTYLNQTQHKTFCEFKGQAAYWAIQVGEKVIQNAAWSYPNPSPGYRALKDHIAFYPSSMDICYVDDEVVQPQAGDFYGGWITSNIVGPFKGGPGTRGW